MRFQLCFVWCVMIAMLAFFVSCRGGRQSALTAFETAIGRPVPASVTVLESEHYTGFSTTVRLHFTIAPSDLDVLLSGSRWTSCGVSEVAFGGKKPKWWQPETLGKEARLFRTEVDKAAGNYWSRNLYVGPGSNEVYAFCSQI